MTPPPVLREQLLAQAVLAADAFTVVAMSRDPLGAGLDLLELAAMRCAGALTLLLRPELAEAVPPA